MGYWQEYLDLLAACFASGGIVAALSSCIGPLFLVCTDVIPCCCHDCGPYVVLLVGLMVQPLELWACQRSLSVVWLACSKIIANCISAWSWMSPILKGAAGCKCFRAWIRPLAAHMAASTDDCLAWLCVRKNATMFKRCSELVWWTWMV
jgi:hypothetical protein